MFNSRLLLHSSLNSSVFAPILIFLALVFHHISVLLPLLFFHVFNALPAPHQHAVFVKYISSSQQPIVSTQRVLSNTSVAPSHMLPNTIKKKVCLIHINILCLDNTNKTHSVSLWNKMKLYKSRWLRSAGAELLLVYKAKHLISW